MFGTLKADAPCSVDGVLDPPGLPLDAELGDVRAGLQATRSLRGQGWSR